MKRDKIDKKKIFFCSTNSFEYEKNDGIGNNLFSLNRVYSEINRFIFFSIIFQPLESPTRSNDIDVPMRESVIVAPSTSSSQSLAEQSIAAGVTPSPFSSSAAMFDAIRRIEDRYKDEFTMSAELPYKANMVRHHNKNQPGTDEERIKKECQTMSSRVSRHKLKFVQNRMAADNDAMYKVLKEKINMLVNMECFIDDVLMKNGHDAIDWQAAWANESACAAANVGDGNDTDTIDATMTNGSSVPQPKRRRRGIKPKVKRELVDDDDTASSPDSVQMPIVE